MINYIQSSCDIPRTMNEPMIICEDNVTCTIQAKRGYIKRDQTKYIS